MSPLPPARSATSGVGTAGRQLVTAPALSEDAESDASSDSGDGGDGEEEGSPARSAVWSRPARLLRPVRRLMEIRQLCPHLQLLQSFVGSALDDDSDEERLERAKQPAATASGQGCDAAVVATPYWPPASWSALERQSPAPPPLLPKAARGGRGESGGLKRLGSRRHGGQTLFVDQGRAAAFSTVRDIKITLQRRTLAGEWPSTERADWRTLASEAETAVRRRRYRYAVNLFSKVSETNDKM